MRVFCLLVTGSILSTLSGCASVTGSPNQSISVETREQGGKQVVGATCELTNNKGKWFVTTPGSVMIHRSNDDMQVLCNKDTYDPGRAAVVSEIKGAMFGNIILGGGIGAIIDHNNGTAYEYPTLIRVLMGAFSKIEPQTSPEVPNQKTYSENPSFAAQSSATSSTTSIAPTKSGVSKEQRLQELKALFDKGLISEDLYLEQQRKTVSTGE